MSKETGGPAFPIWHETSVCASGMSIRDHFAGMALQGDWAAQDDDNLGAFSCDVQQEILIKRAQLYYRMADAMLKARSE